MANSDELRALREELRKLLAQAEALSTRIDALEASDAQRRPAPGKSAAPKPEPPAAIELPPHAPGRRTPPPPPPPPPSQTAAPSVKGLVGTREKAWAVRLIEERVEAIRRSRQELGWELQVGTYWIPRAAVVLIAIAVVFFLSLAIERWGAHWAPHFRVATGYAVCAGLLLLAWRFEKRYRGFALVLYAGGFALSYLVTFATHYIPFSRIFESPIPALVLLAAIVIAWAVAAQVRRSRVVAVMVTFLGHLTVLLSTTTLPWHTVYSAAGIVFLSAGSAFFLLRNRWYYVAALGLVGSYLNYAVFLWYSPGSDLFVDFAAAMGILTAFLLVFSLAELFAPEALRREKVPVWFRSCFVTANTAAFLVLGSIIVHNFVFAEGHYDAFLLATAVVLMLIALAYLRRRGRDPLYNAYLTKGVALLTLGLAVRYSGTSLSAWLAVETVVLLVSARRSGLVVTRILAFFLGAIALGHGLFTAFELGPVAYRASSHTSHVVRWALGVASFLVASQVYQRTDWTLRAPQTLPLPPHWLRRWWQLDLLAEWPGEGAPERKPLDGLLFPLLYALAGAALFVAAAWVLVEPGHRLLALAVGAAVLTALAVPFRSQPFGAASLCLVAVALPVATAEITGEKPAANAVWLVSAGALALVALSSEKRLAKGRPGLEAHGRAPSPYFLYGAVACVLGLGVACEFVELDASLVLAAMATVAALLFLVLHPRALAAVSTGLLVWGGALYLVYLAEEAVYHTGKLRAVAATLAGLSLLADRHFAFFKKRGDTALFGAILVVYGWVVLLVYAQAELPEGWPATAAAALGFFYLIYGLAFRQPTALVVAGLGALLASVAHSLQVYAEEISRGALVCAFVLLAAFWIACERLYARWPKGGDEKTRLTVSGVLVGVPVALLLILLERVPNALEANLTWITIGWFALAVLSIVFSLPTRQRLYRYAGLAVIVLSLARVFLIDMRETDAIFRVLAFAVLGAGLLPISYGYFRWLERVRSRTREDGPAASP